jgi:hypothetical protein
MRPVLLKKRMLVEVSLTPPDIAKLSILQALTSIVGLEYGVLNQIWNVPPEGNLGSLTG